MSWCMCSAVCCVLVTCSMSGVALGYNYSLAEFIDLKETNVSVYIKRGVFDDDVIKDMTDFRRRGHQPPKGLTRSDDLKTAEEAGPDEIPDTRRRLEDTIVSSNDNNNFEGSLMKLTLKPAFESTLATKIPDDSAMIPLASSFKPDSLDQLKAIQGLINARKSGASRNLLEKTNNNNREPSYNIAGISEQDRRMLSNLVRRFGNDVTANKSPETKQIQGPMDTDDPSGVMNKLKNPGSGRQDLDRKNNPSSFRNTLPHLRAFEPGTPYNSDQRRNMPSHPLVAELANQGGNTDRLSDQSRRMLSILKGPGYEKPEIIEFRGQESTQDPSYPSINPARFAVPDLQVWGNWESPKLDTETYRRLYNVDDIVDYTKPKPPQPVTYRTGPIRPSTTEQWVKYEPVSVAASAQVVTHSPPPPQRSGDEKNIMGEERFDDKSGSEDIAKKDFLDKLPGPKIVGQENNEYYDDELKGLPVRRRRRSINNDIAKQLRANIRAEKAISQKTSPSHLTKFKVSNSNSKENTVYPSILVSKLHFLDNTSSNETTSANEKEVSTNDKAVRATVNDTPSIIDSLLNAVLKAKRFIDE